MEAIKSAADTTKQFVTLATGVLAVTITFADKLGLGYSRVPLFLAWLAFMAVIVMGTLTLMEITSEIDRAEKDARARNAAAAAAAATAAAGTPAPAEVKPAPDPLAPKITKLAKPMVFAFWGGIGMVLAAGIIVIACPAEPPPAPACPVPAAPPPAPQALPKT